MFNNLSPQARYILPSFEERTAYGTKTQDPYTKLFSERVIFLGAPVDDVSANDIVSQLLVLASIDPDRDITMYINSPGGESMTALTSIVDTMAFVKPEISTVCIGQASAGAAVILASGTFGKRIILPNARVVLNQPGHNGQRGQASDIDIQAQELQRLRAWMEQTLADTTGNDVEKVRRDIERDKFLTAATAFEYGIIDKIIIPPVKTKRIAKKS